MTTPYANVPGVVVVVPPDVVDVAAVACKSSTVTPPVLAVKSIASSPKVNDSVKLNASPAVLIS